MVSKDSSFSFSLNLLTSIIVDIIVGSFFVWLGFFVVFVGLIFVCLFCGGFFWCLFWVLVFFANRLKNTSREK